MEASTIIGQDTSIITSVSNKTSIKPCVKVGPIGSKCGNSSRTCRIWEWDWIVLPDSRIVLAETSHEDTAQLELIRGICIDNDISGIVGINLSYTSINENRR